MPKNISIKEPYPPGDFAIWIIIYVELLTFGLLFSGYAFSRRADVALFNESQLLLNQTAGFINTLILITSSYFIVKAVQSIKNMQQETHIEANQTASKWLLAAMLLGGTFIIIKLVEFSDIFAEGITLSTNTFYMFYLLLTMFHFMHVLLGLIILGNIYQKTKRHGYTKDDHIGMETGASYWHLVDLLWIVLFPLIYIIR
ncbi:cytochrome c oxidase subunit 3 family protein [Sulfurovum sp.]|uniref:cytochrome c oxidase subunit 3 family protein n=1 Tax=Sulfurovum sp. TaxID=1969726 RepID=UPI002867E14C|nr:cytochrome c oxidase subunit 3 family protein [Sulfurovum sp.]